MLLLQLLLELLLLLLPLLMFQVLTDLCFVAMVGGETALERSRWSALQR